MSLFIYDVFNLRNLLYLIAAAAGRLQRKHHHTAQKEYLDFETGTYYLRVRYYDSTIGTDPVVDTTETHC